MPGIRGNHGRLEAAQPERLHLVVQLHGSAHARERVERGAGSIGLERSTGGHPQDVHLEELAGLGSRGSGLTRVRAVERARSRGRHDGH